MSGSRSALKRQGNSGGGYLNFDLAWPSTSIPDTFFPSDVALYGMSYSQDHTVNGFR